MRLPSIICWIVVLVLLVPLACADESSDPDCVPREHGIEEWPPTKEQLVGTWSECRSCFDCPPPWCRFFSDGTLQFLEPQSLVPSGPRVDFQIAPERSTNDENNANNVNNSTSTTDAGNEAGENPQYEIQRSNGQKIVGLSGIVSPSQLRTEGVVMTAVSCR